MRKVIFCDDINSVNNKIYTECDVIITAYSAMVISVGKILEGIGAKAPVISMAKVQKKVFPFLDDKNNTIKNKLTASEVIDNIVGNEEQKLRFQNDIDNIMASIKVVIECGVDIDKLLKDNPTQDEQLFLKLYKRIILEDSYIDYIATVNKYKYNPSLFEVDFVESIKSLCNDIKIKYEEKYKDFKVVNKKIVLMGYYIITPPQEMIFSFLEQCGYELIFVLTYNPELKKVNDIINITYNIKLNSEVYTTYGKYEINLATIFGMLLDNKNLENTLEFNLKDLSEKISFRVFNNKYRYQKENIELLKNKELVLSCNPQENINEMINIDSRISRNRVSIKNYPLGQFIYEIYKMWDSFRGKLVLDAERIEKCFATKLVVNSEGENAFNYLYDFNLIKDYYRNCETIAEWKVALSDLKDNLSNDKMKSIIGYGPKIVGIEKVTKILEFIIFIEEIATLIFRNDCYEMNLKSHLITLERVINRTSSNVEDNFIVEELLDRIKMLLENNTIASIRVGNKHLLDTITGYLSHIKIEDSDNDFDSDQLISNGVSKLFKVDTIESFICTNCSKIYVNDINKYTFVKKGELTWPLKVERFSHLLSEDIDELSKKLIQRMLIITDNQAAASRYFYWLILNFKGEIIFSRFEDQDDDSAHFYERELMRFLEKKYQPEKVEEKNEEKPGFKIVYIDKNNTNNRKVSVDIEKMKFCYIRAFMSSYTNEAYAEGYQIDMALANLLYSIAINPKLSKNEVGRYIDKICPGLSGFRKNELYNFYNKLVLNKDTNTEKTVVLNKTAIDLEDDFKKFKEQVSSNKPINIAGDDVEEYFQNLKKGIIPRGINLITHCRECPYRIFCIEQVFEEVSE